MSFYILLLWTSEHFISDVVTGGNIDTIISRVLGFHFVIFLKGHAKEGPASVPF